MVPALVDVTRVTRGRRNIHQYFLSGLERSWLHEDELGRLWIYIQTVPPFINRSVSLSVYERLLWIADG